MPGIGTSMMLHRKKDTHPGESKTRKSPSRGTYRDENIHNENMTKRAATDCLGQ